MVYVSVGQVENLEEAVSGVQCIYEETKGLVREIIDTGKLKVETLQSEVQECEENLQKSIEGEAQCQYAMENCVQKLSEAYTALEDAELSLSYCESRIRYAADDDYVFPDCSSEESAVHSARSEIMEIQTEVLAKEREYESAKNYHEKMELKTEMMHRCLDQTVHLTDMMEIECQARLGSLHEVADQGKRRLESAKSALNHYLNTHPEAKSFYNWLKWEPEKNRPIRPDTLNARLNLTFEEQALYLNYLMERDPAFRNKIGEYRTLLSEAKGDAEKLAVQLKIRRNLSGYYGEKIVETALGALAHKTDTQGVTITDNGRYTKTDIILEDLKVPVISGRGEGRSAPVGGSIAIEVKFGKAEYIYAQKSHMIFQSQGHKRADTAVTICSRDIKNLSESQEKEIRDALSEAGSPLIGMLPTKEEVDKALWTLVTSENHFQGEENEN